MKQTAAPGLPTTEVAMRTYLIPLAILATALVVFVGLVEPPLVLN